MFLEIKNISKSYDGKKIIENINISIDKGQFVSLLGKSGSGKTTLFNILSNTEKADNGNVYLNNKDISEERSAFSYMQQKDLLLPFYTIIDNISLPLIIQGYDKKTAKDKILPLLEEFDLIEIENKYPHQLSGGMRQRASLLRAYIHSQNIMLLDEPFSSLDYMTKNTIYQWYKKMAKKNNTTTFLITHNVDEAIILSDKIYILKGNPATINDEFFINDKTDNFELTKEFLEYKKIIKEKLDI